MSPMSDDEKRRVVRRERARGKRVTVFGRNCLTCEQYVMPFEVRQGKFCVYCKPDVPDVLDGPEVLATEHKLALDEDRRRRRAQ